MRTISNCIAALLTLTATSLIAAPGDPDLAFGNGGRVITKMGTAYHEARGIGVQTDGKYLAAFDALGFETFRGALLRFNADHTLDTSYGYQGQAFTAGLVSALVMDGNIAVTADYQYQWLLDTSSATQVYYRPVGITRYGADGAPSAATSPAFNAGVGGDQRLSAIAFAPDGKIVAAGFTTVGSPYGDVKNVLIARFNTNLTLDTTFGGGKGWMVSPVGEPAGSPSFANGVIVESGGKIVVSGQIPPTYRSFVARFQADGSGLDPTFGAPYANTPGVFPSGSQCGGLIATPAAYVIACTSNLSGSQAQVFRMSLNGGSPLGSTLVDFGGPSGFTSLARRADGKIAAVGWGGPSYPWPLVAAVLNPDFSLDSTFFGSAGTYTEPSSGGAFATSIAFMANEIAVAGYRDPGPASDADAMVITVGAAGRTSFQALQPTSSASFTKVKILGDGRIVAAGVVGLAGVRSGAFTNTSNFSVMRLNANGTPDASFGSGNGVGVMPIPNMDFLVGARKMAIQPDGKVLTTGDFGGGPLNVFRLGAARFTAYGNPDTLFNAGGTPGYAFRDSGGSTSGNRFARAVAVQADGKVLVGGSAVPVGARQMAVVRFNADGTLDTSYGSSGLATTSTGGTGRDMELQGGQALVVGTSGPSIVLARFNTNGSLDAAFGSGGVQTISMPSGFTLQLPNRVLVRPDSKIVIAVSGLSATGCAFGTFMLNADGTPESGNGFHMFDVYPGPYATCAPFDAALTPNGKLVVIGFAMPNDAIISNYVVARFNRDGTPDTGFGANGVRSYAGSYETQFNGIDVAADGAMVLAGIFEPGSERMGLIMKTVADPSAVTAAPTVRVARDFNGDGKSDILIRDNVNGLVYGWLMDGIAVTSGGYVLGAGSGWTPVRVADLNGDGKADILIQHTDGSVYIWLMDGLNVVGGGYLLGAGSGWSVSHVGDFDGDGKADVLLKHTDGSIYIQTMNGTVATGGTFLQGAGTGWSATHVADFNGDGKSDVLLKHTDGSIYIWQMNGIAIAAGTFLKGAGIDWSATETGDFNGDAKADILITHTNGGVYLWQMNGLSIETGTYLLSPGSGWSIAKTGDLDGDAKSDILLAHTDGSLYAWLMNGLNVTGGAYLLGTGSPWSLSHLLDLNGDGKADILIKHTDGSIYAWVMNGATITSGAYLMGAGNWRVAP